MAVNKEEGIVGVVTAYTLPEDVNTLFIWQIAVHPDARGQGLASKLLMHLINMSSNVKVIQTTISPSNTASLSSFKKLAQSLNATFHVEEFLKTNACGQGHEAEDLITIAIP